jgi:lysophospholipase L1-like esterase
MLAAFGAALVLVGLGILPARAESALVGVSLAAGVLVAEGVLQVLDLPPTMPAELRAVPVEPPPGTVRAVRWMGRVHASTAEGFRAPPAASEVVALGDSYTYGVGVAESEAWPALVGATNLGIPGAQSEDVAAIARTWLPRLRPRTVVYGVCGNDLLPSGAAQATRTLPWWTAQTRIGLLAGAAWRATGPSFYEDITARGEPARFARDLAAIRDAAAEVGADLVVVVLDVHTETPEAQALARTIAEAGRSVGVEVLVPAHGGAPVSRWEGHPDAATHRAYATWVSSYIARCFRRGSPRSRRRRIRCTVVRPSSSSAAIARSLMPRPTR